MVVEPALIVLDSGSNSAEWMYSSCVPSRIRVSFPIVPFGPLFAKFVIELPRRDDCFFPDALTSFVVDYIYIVVGGVRWTSKVGSKWIARAGISARFPDDHQNESTGAVFRRFRHYFLVLATRIDVECFIISYFSS